MVWKLLSALSAVCLGVACYFAFSNKNELAEEKKRLAYYNANLELTKEHTAKLAEAKKGYEGRVAEMTQTLDADKRAVLETAEKADTKAKELELLKGNLEQVNKVVNTLKEKIRDAGDIPALLAQIEAIRKERSEAEAALANQNQRFAAAQERINALNEAAKETEEREARGRRGIVDDDFTAKIAKSYTDWGFVVLNKGNGGGVFANADLEVKRGKDVIAKLKVRNVEQNSSVAELVPGSLVEGNSIRSGDTVVAAAKQSVEAERGTTAPAAAGAPAATPPPAAAPGAAPAGAPMNNDPFGAPAAAPAGAPMNNDPFGAPAAPAPGAAPMSNDPFGAPAPAAGAPAAPAAGTPAAPSTVDPFGAPPAKP